jgi:hypothetical protein
MSWEANFNFVFIKPTDLKAVPARGDIVSVGNEVDDDVEVGNSVLFDVMDATDIDNGLVAVRSHNLIAVDCYEDNEEVYREFDKELASPDVSSLRNATVDTLVSAIYGNALLACKKDKELRMRLVKIGALTVGAIDCLDGKS